MEKKYTFLLIDDDEATNYLHQIVIKELGYADKVVIAKHGKEALELLAGSNDEGNSLQPDLIFLDINMPVMDGWEFIAAYNQLPEKKRAQAIVIMLTTSLNPEDRERSQKEFGIKDFLNKPLKKEDVIEVINSNLK